MSKFAAWATLPVRNDNDCGIRLQDYTQTASQLRQYIDIKGFDVVRPIYEVHTSDTLSVNWSKPEYIFDGNPDTIWSSTPGQSNSDDKWFACWFHQATVNYLDIRPRRIGNPDSRRTLCCPKTISLSYATNRPDEWIPIKTLRLEDRYYDFDVIRISLDQTVESQGILIEARELTDDGEGGYYLQVAGVEAGLTEARFDPEDTANKASKFPDSMFFFGDEIDMVTTADEYAKAYLQFADAIKQGSSGRARISPCGFTFANNINGPSYLDYATRFRNALAGGRVDEWRFHQFFYLDIAPWKGAVKAAIDWTHQTGTQMVVGSFGAPGVPQHFDIRPALQEAMCFINEDEMVSEAVYWSFNKGDWPHHLVTDDGGGLTDVGRTFVENM